MQGPGLITIIIVVVVILFVGVILAFVFTTRSSKGKISAGEAAKVDVNLPDDRGQEPVKDATARKTIDLRDLQAGSENSGLQLILDDDRVFQISLPSSLGRSQENTIEISDPTVSAQHAVVYFDQRAEAVCIEDLDSTNGIFIDGRPTKKSILDDGARLTIGGVSLTFRDTSSLPPTP